MKKVKYQSDLLIGVIRCVGTRLGNTYSGVTVLYVVNIGSKARLFRVEIRCDRIFDAVENVALSKDLSTHATVDT